MVKTKKRILVIDDEGPIADMLATFCSHFGFESKSVSNWREISDEVEKFRPHLILLDLSMPGMLGTEILKGLKKNPSSKTIPVLVLSGYLDASPQNEVRQLSSGALTKPVRMNVLRETINAILVN